MKTKKNNLAGDLYGGLASMLVAFPSAIAFGLIIFSPLGQDFLAKGALVGIIGVILIGILAPLLGGSKNLISAPCAPAAAILSAFVIEQAPLTGPGTITAMILLIAIITGIFQVIIGLLKVGSFIKYIPYPVVAGYLSSVGILIVTGQMSKFLGTGSQVGFFQSVSHPETWGLNGLFVGIVAMLAMLISNRIFKKIPATIVSISFAIAAYWILSLFFNHLQVLENNPLVIGKISAGFESILNLIHDNWLGILSLNADLIGKVVITALTLAVLLSVDTLKTCLVVDAMTKNRHNSNRELLGQGIANFFSGLMCGMPGAGTMGATLVSIQSGGNTYRAGFFEGIFSLFVFFALSAWIAWVPIAALAAILIVIGIRMIDLKTFFLLRNKSTVFDFVVYFCVVLTAVLFNLIAAAGVGILLSIFLFLRNEVRQSVVRRKAFASQIFSKKRRKPEQRLYLNEKGNQIMLLELQGPLFFGTADQLMNVLEAHLSSVKYLILDMRRVHSLDYTAVHRLHQIEESVNENQGCLILTSVPLYVPIGQNIQEYLENLGFKRSEKGIKFFDDINAGLQWAEDELLKEQEAQEQEADELLSLCDFHIFKGMEPHLLEQLEQVMAEKVYQAGQTIFTQGSPGSEIYFIRRGTVQIYLPVSPEKNEHLTTFSKGDYFGDMSFLTSETRSANAVADEKTVLFILNRAQFDVIAEKNKVISELFFSKLAIDLTERLRQNHIMLKALAE